MFKALAAAVVFVATAAPAQATSYQTDKPAAVKGNPDKIVCQKVEKIGSRLSAKKVCLTVREWTARAKEDRDGTDRIQRNAAICEKIDCS